MIELSVAELKMFSLESDFFLWIKPKEKKKIVESLDQCRRLEVPEKVRNVFCDEPTSVWPQGVTQHRIFKFFCDVARIFSLFSLVFQIFGVAKLKMFSPESKIFLWIKPKKKNFFVESLDQYRRLELREKTRIVFCDKPTSVWPQGVTQHRIFKFFAMSLGFSRCFRSYFKFLELKEFNKTIVPFALVGYETGYTISYPTRAHGIIVKYMRKLCCWVGRKV